MMRILVCNDDGIDAVGIRLLTNAALAIGRDVWVVAPERKWTAASHQLTFDRDLTLTKRAERTYACSGAPADCVVAAMTVLFAGASRPELVLAGVNDKRNVGEDLAYSGTQAIAREATFWDVPAIALSRTPHGTDAPADAAALRQLLRVVWNSRSDWATDGYWLSINLPASLPAPLVSGRVGRDKIASACDLVERTPEHFTYRIRRDRPGTRTPGDENALIDAGCITVVRHRWFSEAALPESLVAAWSSAVAYGAQ